MDILFGLGEGAAEDIRARLTDPPSYSAVRALLARLEAKGHIKHREEGLRYVYTPLCPDHRPPRRVEAVRPHILRRVRRRDGDVAAPHESWSDDELAPCRTRSIARARKGNGDGPLAVAQDCTVALGLGLGATRCCPPCPGLRPTRHPDVDIRRPDRGAAVATLLPDLRVAVQSPALTLTQVVPDVMFANG